MRYETLIDMEMQPAVLAMSLKKLTTLLEKHYGQKVVVLIDGYDVPLAKAYENNFYDKMVLLLRNLFGNVFENECEPCVCGFNWMFAHCQGKYIHWIE